LLPTGPSGEDRLKIVERRMGSLQQDSRVASSKFQELPEAASTQTLRKAGHWYLAGSLGDQPGITANTALLESYLYLVPLYVPVRPGIMDGVGFVVAVKGAGSVRLGVYADDGSIAPGRLIEDFGEVDVSSTGFKSVTSKKVALGRGLVWFAMCTDLAGTIRLNAITEHFWALLGVSTSAPTTGYPAYNTAHVYGCMPDYLGDSVTLNKIQFAPCVLVKFA
ncbi:unnamed protein product, partial [marine sediment metagenome]